MVKEILATDSQGRKVSIQVRPPKTYMGSWGLEIERHDNTVLTVCFDHFWWKELIIEMLRASP